MQVEVIVSGVKLEFRKKGEPEVQEKVFLDTPVDFRFDGKYKSTQTVIKKYQGLPGRKDRMTMRFEVTYDPDASSVTTDVRVLDYDLRDSGHDLVRVGDYTANSTLI